MENWIVRIYRGDKVIDSFTIDGNRTENQAAKEAMAEVNKISDDSIDWSLTREPYEKNKKYIVFWQNNRRLGSVILNRWSKLICNQMFRYQLIQTDVGGTEHWEIIGLIETSRKELFRMIDNVERRITSVNQMVTTLLSNGLWFDDELGLPRESFGMLKTMQSRLIKVSTALHIKVHNQLKNEKGKEY